MAFNWNFKPRTRKGFYSAPVESLMPQAPGAIPTQMKGQVNLPEIEQPFDFNSYFTNLVNREEMDGYHPAQNFSVPNQQHGGNPAVNYAGYSPTTPMTEQDVINQNLAERQTGNADDMANWIQQGGTPQADAAAAAQAQAKEQQIADIESQIVTLQKRIDDNKAKLQKWTGNADQIAAIEARKINSADPTSIWRWKVDHDEARRIAKMEKDKTKELAKSNALIEANNILGSMIINDSLDTPTKNAMLSKLADVKTNLEKNGLPTKDVDEKIKKLKGNGEQTTREQAKTTWHGLQGKKDLTSAELDAAINDPNINWDPNDLEDAKNLSDKLKKHEAATQSVKDMKADYKRRTGKDFDKADPYIQKKEQERWKRRNKK